VSVNIGTVFLAWNAYPEPVAIEKNLRELN